MARPVARMTVAELIDRVRASRARWDAALALVPEERVTEESLAGPWSVKDVIAHLTWFEAEMVGVIRARALVGSDLWLLDPDERNAEIHRQNVDRPVEEIRAEAKRVHGELLAALATLDQEDLTDPGRFRDMPPNWVPAEIFAQNTFEHYDAHAAGLENWLSR